MATDTSYSYNYKWLELEKSDGYLLSLNLPPEFNAVEDFRVRVDGKRRLTITDRRKPTPGSNTNKPLLRRINKTTFQLPKTANPYAVTGCFDGVELALTVPKKRAADTDAVKKEAEAARKAKANAKDKEKENEEVKEKAAPKRENAAAEGLKSLLAAEGAGSEKELMVATAVAAFTFGVLVSHRHFSRRN